MMPCAVRRFQRLRDLLRDRQGVVELNRAVPDPVGERRPFDQLEHEGADTVRFFQAVDRADVRMIQ